MNFDRRPKPLVLCILDGWGDRPKADDNAIAAAVTPNWHKLVARWPHAHLQASEHYVGLPDGQMGNSEVGHTNLGAGRLVLQDLPRIDAAIAAGELAAMPALRDFVGNLKESRGTAHLAGLMSPGGVHSHQRQIAAIARILATAGIDVAVHAFLDGRDTPPKSAVGYLERFGDDTAGHARVRIATICGRYYAMDRDRRWDRVEKAYRALTAGAGEQAADAAAAVAAAYARGETDEFVLPTAVGGYCGMRDGDGLALVNFRADRVREIATALLDPDFSDFSRQKRIAFAAAFGLTEYSTELNRFLATLFPPEDLADTFGEVVSRAGLGQLRIAETEKYAHVTFFFNGGRETVFPGEKRLLVPSPKVATYDQQPEMSALEVTDEVVASDPGRRLRRHRAQLCQRRHGWAHRRYRSGGQSSRDCRHLSRPIVASGRGGGWHPRHHRRPRQCRDDARPRDRRAAYRAYPEPGAAHRGQPTSPDRASRRRPACRCGPDLARPARSAPAGGDDRTLADCGAITGETLLP